MSFLEEAEAVAEFAGSNAVCDECGRPPHPLTMSLYRVYQGFSKVCLSCFFEILGREKRAKQDTDEFKEAIQQRHEHSLLFMGNGEHSAQRRRDLMNRIDVAFEFMSGAQQAPMSTDSRACCEAHRKYCEMTNRIIDSVVRDFAMAMTGKEWEPTEE